MIVELPADSPAYREIKCPVNSLLLQHPPSGVLLGISLISNPKKNMEKSSYSMVNFRPEFIELLIAEYCVTYAVIRNEIRCCYGLGI